MRIIVAGAVRSSQSVLKALLAHGLEVVAVFGHMPADVSRVSGLLSLEPIAKEAGVPFHPFRNINDERETIRALKPDLFFVVGLSQLIAEDIIAMPTHGCVGFHPTQLPERRGRAPLAWLVLEHANGAANFFRIGAGADDGPVYASADFVVDEDDDAEQVSLKISQAIDRALVEWLPRLKAGDLTAVEQDHSKASWRGRRGPEDGWIDWHADAAIIRRQVLSAARPHPGAYTFAGDAKFIVWRASVETAYPALGVVGRILDVHEDGSFIVQCGQGHLRVEEYEIDGPTSAPRTGVRLGYYAEAEIHQLRQTVASLEARLEALEETNRRGA